MQSITISECKITQIILNGKIFFSTTVKNGEKAKKILPIQKKFVILSRQKNA
jgi:hypothetical protein